MRGSLSRWFLNIPVIVSIILPLSSYCLCEEIKIDAPAQLSLRDLIKTAFFANKEIQMQEEDIAAARADILYARSAFLPKFNIDTSYTHTDAVLYSEPFPGNRKDTRIFGGYKNDNQLGFTASETIYDGGANIANLEQAKLNLKVAEETLRAKKLDVEFEAKRLYYGLILSYEVQRITQNLFDQAMAHYRNVASKFDQGTASKFDLLQSKVQVTKIMPELVKSRNASEIIKADLKKLISYAMSDELEIKDDRLKYSLIEIKEDEFLKTAYRQKPEMILRLLGIDIKRWAMQTAESTILPQINADVGYLYRSNDIGNMVNPRHDNWNAGISIVIPIFDGFSTKAKVDAAKAKYSQARIEKENVADQIAVDIRQACLDLKQYNAIINSQKDSMGEAREALGIANVGYDNGVITNLDVLDAEVSLSQVEKNLVEAVYDYLMAKAQLDRLMGQQYVAELQG